LPGRNSSTRPGKARAHTEPRHDDRVGRDGARLDEPPGLDRPRGISNKEQFEPLDSSEFFQDEKRIRKAVQIAMKPI
jgi:hypothetical protein